MTDTTDIKALRDAIRYCSIANEMYGTEFQGAKFKLMKVATPELLSSILDQLEAERQRAEKAEKSNTFLKEQLAQLANFNQDWDMLEACRESWREVVALLKERDAELAALKAKLANPVVLPRTIWYEHDDLPREIPVLEKRLVIAGIRLAGFTVKGE